MSCKGCALSVAIGLAPGDSTGAETLLNMKADDIKKYLVYPSDRENAKFIVNHSFEPLTLGHLVVQPVKCQKSSSQIHDLDPQETQRLFTVVQASSKALQELLNPPRIYFWSFNEQSNGNNWHLHVHVAPRFTSLRGSGWLYFLDNAPKKPVSVDKDKIEGLVVQLREKMSRIVANYFASE